MAAPPSIPIPRDTAIRTLQAAFQQTKKQLAALEKRIAALDAGVTKINVAARRAAASAPSEDITFIFQRSSVEDAFTPIETRDDGFLDESFIDFVQEWADDSGDRIVATRGDGVLDGTLSVGTTRHVIEGKTLFVPDDMVFLLTPHNFVLDGDMILDGDTAEM